MGKKKRINKEELAEDCCFFCKDGGVLRICDYGDCLKAYHPLCVGKDDSFLETEDPWNCKLHYCFMCKRSSKFHCFCCSTALCRYCLRKAEFAVVRGKKGFCFHCFTLICLLEEDKAPDSKKGMINFSDKDTYEYMFSYYWKGIKEKEGLTMEHVSRAKKLFSKNKNYGADDMYAIEDFSTNLEDESQVSDYDDLGDTDNSMRTRKRKKGKSFLSRGKVKSREDFTGWGSKPLFDFLTTVGKSPEEELSQHQVASIINMYCREHCLFHPEKKKKIICDAKLQSLLGRKIVTRNGINKLLSNHFAVNFELSEDEAGYNLEDEERDDRTQCIKEKTSSPNEKSQRKGVLEEKRSGFASIVADNIKLVYLKKSLVIELSKHPKSFNDKVIGSFVRVRSDPYDCFQKNSHQLLQVIGIKGTSGNSGVDLNIFLQASYMLRDISIYELSDDNFSEEECIDLRTRIKNGLIRRLTIVEFEHKARMLHEDITKHWISREMAKLQNLINQANEKGWRRELGGYMDRLFQLQTPEEQTRLLNEMPEVIADKADEESSCKNEQEHNPPTKSVLEEDGDIDHLDSAAEIKEPGFNSEDNQNTEDLIENDVKGATDSAQSNSAPGLVESGFCCEDDQSREDFDKNDEKDVMGETDIDSKCSILGQILSGSRDEIRSREESGRNDEEDVKGKSVSFNKSQSETCGQRTEGVDASKDGSKKMHSVIELSDDEDRNTSTPRSQKQRPGCVKAQDDLKAEIWHIISPTGLQNGPFSMALIKKWSETSSYTLQFKAWKTGQSPKEAMALRNVIQQFSRF